MNQRLENGLIAVHRNGWLMICSLNFMLNLAKIAVMIGG